MKGGKGFFFRISLWNDWEFPELICCMLGKLLSEFSKGYAFNRQRITERRTLWLILTESLWVVDSSNASLTFPCLNITSAEIWCSILILISERIPFSVKGIWSELARGGGGTPIFRKIVRIERSPVRVASPAGVFRGRNTSSPKNACGGGYGTGGKRAAILVSYGTEEASWKRVSRFDTHPRWTPVAKSPRSRRSYGKIGDCHGLLPSQNTSG